MTPDIRIKKVSNGFVLTYGVERNDDTTMWQDRWIEQRVRVFMNKQELLEFLREELK